jgi:hypothetical protein
LELCASVAGGRYSGAREFWHDIFFIVIPTSGTQEARRTVLFSPQAFFPQPFLFQKVINWFYRRFFEDFVRRAGSVLHRICYSGISGFPAPNESFNAVRFLYITYVSANTSGTYLTEVKPESVHGANL